MKRADLAQNIRRKRMSQVCYRLGDESAPQKGICFSHQFLGLNWPNCKGPIEPCEGLIWKMLAPLWDLKWPKQPPTFQPFCKWLLKEIQFNSMLNHFRSRGVFCLHADFCPYCQIMKINLIPYLLNTHLLGSKYCFRKTFYNNEESCGIKYTKFDTSFNKTGHIHLW